MSTDLATHCTDLLIDAVSIRSVGISEHTAGTTIVIFLAEYPTDPAALLDDFARLGWTLTSVTPGTGALDGQVELAGTTHAVHVTTEGRLRDAGPDPRYDATRIVASRSRVASRLIDARSERAGR